MNATERDLLTRCPYCEAEIETTDTYCGNCGSRILEDVPPVSGGSPAVADATIATTDGVVIAEVTHTDVTDKPKRKKKEPKPTATHYRVTLPYSVFALADKIARKDASRPVLNCIAVYLKRGYVTAADGFQLATLPVTVDTAGDEPEDRHILIQRDDLLSARKLAKRGEDLSLWITPEETILYVTGTRGNVTPITIAPMYGTFPDVQQIIPKPDADNLVSIAFSPELLAKLAALATANGNTVMRFHFTGKNSAARIDSNDKEAPFTAVLMPMIFGGE